MLWRVSLVWWPLWTSWSQSVIKIFLASSRLVAVVVLQSSLGLQLCYLSSLPGRLISWRRWFRNWTRTMSSCWTIRLKGRSAATPRSSLSSQFLQASCTNWIIKLNCFSYNVEQPVSFKKRMISTEKYMLPSKVCWNKAFWQDRCGIHWVEQSEAWFAKGADTISLYLSLSLFLCLSVSLSFSLSLSPLSCFILVVFPCPSFPNHNHLMQRQCCWGCQKPQLWKHPPSHGPRFSN